MARVLFLCHRLPYPPNKGDKVRSYHLLKHLVARHEVHLGTFVDDPDDEQHLAAVRGLCASLCAVTLRPRLARVASLAGLFEGKALTLAYYRSPALHRWVRALAQPKALDACLVFSSAMGPYAEGLGVPILTDLVDVDSAKWREYAAARRAPASWLYHREARELLAYERQLAKAAQRCFLSTEKEAEMFRRLAPESAAKVQAIGNGVDFDFFDPAVPRPSPFADHETPIVFTGAMDYWPNVDAVTWFAAEVLPRLRAARPNLRLHIVGRSPAAEVRALAGEAVAVSGTVPDVRPYLQHAAVVVAPLRLARGIQNKVLEAMAMARPVVAAQSCVEAIDAEPGVHLLPAASADDYVHHIQALLADPLLAQRVGSAGRQRVRAVYAWDARLAGLDSWLVDPPAPSPRQALMAREIA
jgi:polysaccharide biosynthesis protein PslH